MDNKKIAFIGGGNMAYSLVGGLIAGNCPGPNISVSDPVPEPVLAMQRQFGIVPFVNDNRAAIEGADAVVLAVKPQAMFAVTRELAETIQASSDSTPLFISIAAGIRSSDIARWLNGDLAIVRTMPNTPALLQSGATGLFANEHVSKEQRNLAESILRAVGTTVWLKSEDQIDVVTALSGSGPAYFFLFMEAMEQAAQQLGLEPETARSLTLHTAFGAAKMALERPESSAELRHKVTSPGGTTEQAIQVFQKMGLEKLVADALSAAHARSIELADEFGKDGI